VQGDVLAEGLEAGDEAAGLAFGVCALVEVVLSEVVVGVPGGQDVPVALCPPRGLRRPFRVLG